MVEIVRPDPNGKEPNDNQAQASAGKTTAGSAGGNPNSNRPKRNKKEVWIKRLLLILLVVVALVLLALAVYHLVIEHYMSMIQPPPTDEVYATKTIEETETLDWTEELPVVVLPPEHNGETNTEGLPLICDTRAVTNVLLIGIDARAKGNEAGLSDSMMLLSINRDTKKITLTSLERDTLARIPGHGEEKLNHSHSYGGADLLIETLKDNFNIEVTHWARVNFYSFVDIVDAIGGLDITMTSSEVHFMNYYLSEINELYGRARGTDCLTEADGTYHLNGHQTLAYARNRYTDSDFGRMRRQRNVLDLMMQKAKTLSVFELDHLLTTVLPLITSNMSQEVKHDLAAAVPTFLGYELQTGAVPQEGEYHYGKTPGGLSVVVLNDKKASMERVYESIYGSLPEKETQTQGSN